MTDRRWESRSEARWAWAWMGACGRDYVLVHGRGLERRGRAGPWRSARGWQRGTVVHGHEGLWLPLLLLLVFAAFAGAGVLFALLFALAVMAVTAAGIVVAGALLAGIARAGIAFANATWTMPSRPETGGLSDGPPRRAAPAPYRLAGGSLAAEGGPDLYRRRLLDVLKERYVRGEISLAQFEASAGRIARDPSARHLG